MHESTSSPPPAASGESLATLRRRCAPSVPLRSAILLAAIATGCTGGGQRDQPGSGEMVIEETPGCAGMAAVEFAAELDVDLSLMRERVSGLCVQDVRVGDGAVAAVGDSAYIHYTGWLVDGTKFDSSLDRGEPIEVLAGRPGTIQGWIEGVPGMREGGRRRLLIPAELGYGEEGFLDDQGAAIIPPNAMLVFDLELVKAVPGPH